MNQQDLSKEIVKGFEQGFGIWATCPGPEGSPCGKQANELVWDPHVGWMHMVCKEHKAMAQEMML